MSSNNTIRDLAQKLNAMETISSKNNNSSTNQRRKQEFDYLIVMDFEATCWQEKLDRRAQKHGVNEIIEFSAVLYNVRKRVVAEEFQMYCKPTEQPTLSDFCKNLTGIQQSTVDKGSSISETLVAFDKWLDRLKMSYNLFWVGEVGDYIDFGYLDVGFEHQAAFATWSDWDLGTCLKKECRRKHIERKPYFNQWIDARKAYVDFYNERPEGLIGALRSQRMDFVGVEHCGLDDALNTALLIGRMMEDGALVTITSIIAK